MPRTPPPPSPPPLDAATPGGTVRLDPAWHYHFLGAGGIGMSALAAVMHRQGFRVSGSDAHDGPTLQGLAALGMPVSVGHDPVVLSTADVVVYSSAIGPRHPIWPEVQRLGLPRYHRGEVVGAIAATRRTVAVTGTHGKTTCTGALANAVLLADWDPTVLVGGHMPQLDGANWRLGQGPWLVCEADESDGSFLHLAPEGVLLTNVEADHLDHHGSLDNLVTTFEGLLARIRPEGVLAYCADDPLAGRLGEDAGVRAVSYGFTEGAEVRCHVSHMGSEGMEVTFRHGDREWHLLARITGRQNALNLCGAFTLGYELGLPESALLRGLAGFMGVARRQQYVGEVAGLRVFDDYAHHPTEVRATLQQFRETYEVPLTVVFQPHLYSRTAFFADAFADALRVADRVYVTEIYGAREEPVAGVSGRMLVERLADHPHAEFVPDWEELVPMVLGGKLPEGLLLILGAGDITGLGRQLMRKARTAGGEPGHRAG